LRVVTWNVNSVRSRLDRTLALLERHAPDVLCLQETKVADDGFPRAPFEAAGWHVEAFGESRYNGVALVSRRPPREVRRGLPDDEADAPRRFLAGTFDDVRVASVYVPNGQAPDSPKFPYKLAWFDRLRAGLEADGSPDDPVLVAGDFNVAPEDRDVHDPDAWRGKIHFHPDEHAALGRLMAWGLHDLFRRHEPEGGHYTWWDYRRLAFPLGRGLRIDLALGTAPVRDRCTACWIDRDERKGPKPSDHAPVVVDLTSVG
jgi:exodeoxyribonuclease-3